MNKPGKIINHIDAIRLRQPGLTWEKIALDTGLAYTTVLRWKKSHINRYDRKVLAIFCHYFNVQPSDILEYVKHEQSNS